MLSLWPFALEIRELIHLLLHNHLNDQAADEPVLLQPLLQLSAGHVDLTGAHRLLLSLRLLIHQEHILFLDYIIDLPEAITFDDVGLDLSLIAADELLLLSQVGQCLSLQLSLMLLILILAMIQLCYTTVRIVPHGLVLSGGLRRQSEVRF